MRVYFLLAVLTIRTGAVVAVESHQAATFGGAGFAISSNVNFASVASK